MSTILLSILRPILESSGSVIQHDVAIWPILVVGLVFILVAGAGIIFLIILAVKFLRRLRKPKSENG